LNGVIGEILANVWQTSRIARIDPNTGKVKAWIDLSGLERLAGGDRIDNVLNGIAYDAKQKRLFVTGKRWPKDVRDQAEAVKLRAPPALEHDQLRLNRSS
jgi:glutaminyl-peptide cyclotransferase